MNLVTTNSEQLTMSSREIAELVGSRQDSVKRTMMTLESKGLIAFTQSVEKGEGRPAVLFHVNKRDSYVVVAQLSPEFTARLVDRWQELENKQAPKTQLEVLAGVANGLVEHEKKLTALEQKSEEQQQQIESLKESYSILPSKPANAESIVYIRKRINDMYGLPARIVNEVLYSMHYAPKPAGQVRNTHDNANNSTYTVWNTSEVSKLFKRFVSECEMITKTQAVHPSIDGRFKLNGCEQ